MDNDSNWQLVLSDFISEIKQEFSERIWRDIALRLSGQK